MDVVIMDVVIPIAFPTYRVTFSTPDEVNVPYLGNINLPQRNIKTPEAVTPGHAGVLYVNGENGLTKYYEYGRYDEQNLGKVRKRWLPDAATNRDGLVLDSLREPLRAISRKSGQKKRVYAALIEVEGKFDAIHRYVTSQKAKNANPDRRPYSTTDNNCTHFVKRVLEKAGIDTPMMLDPSPDSFIEDLRDRDDFRSLDYSYKKDELQIAGE